jgi:hypothetical protein
MAMDPEDADYKCTLTEYSLQKAIKELNEDPKQRLGAVQSLRKWIREQPHYTFRTDTTFLLALLRRAKFSQLVARDLVDNIMNARTSYPQYMANLDIQDPNTMAYLDKGIAVYLPQLDKEGRRIAIIRPGATDFKDPRFNPINEVRYSLGLSEMFRCEDENTNVNGAVLVFDCTGMGLKHLNQATPEQHKISSRLYQDCNPERIKAFLVYNAGAFAEIIVTFMKTFLKKKNAERLKTFDTMESLYKVIPMEMWPTEYLPDDYKGPSAGSIASITANMKKRMANPELRARVLANTSDKYKIDESKRPSDNTPKESFRKLNID